MLDRPVGPEEDARVILAAMFDRIVRGPHVALDVEADAPADEVRSAFHALAKQYHPVRFGRMSAETQRLANEVFLGLRMAHDALMKAGRQTTAAGVSPPRNREPTPQPTALGGRPTKSQQPLQPLQPPERRTGPIPIQPPERRSGPIPVMRPAVAPTTNIGRPPAPTPAPAAGTGPRPVQRTPAPSTRPTSPGAVPVPPSGRQTTGSTPVVARTQTEPLRSNAQDGIRIAGTRPPGANPRIISAIELLNRQQWEAARTALSSLATESPESNQVRALLAYATGRQAQFERRLDEARVELQRALQFDPDLTLAKTALAELFARRK